jgi:hypothetical protein
MGQEQLDVRQVIALSDCNSKECHVGAADISAGKKAKYINFLNRIRGNPTI